MKKVRANENRRCPKCGESERQTNAGFNRSGTQRCYCNDCKYKYTLNPKTIEYSEGIKESAIKSYYSGASGRATGRLYQMSHQNVIRWIKKMGPAPALKFAQSED